MKIAVIALQLLLATLSIADRAAAQSQLAIVCRHSESDISNLKNFHVHVLAIDDGRLNIVPWKIEFYNPKTKSIIDEATISDSTFMEDFSDYKDKLNLKISSTTKAGFVFGRSLIFNIHRITIHQNNMDAIAKYSLSFGTGECSCMSDAYEFDDCSTSNVIIQKLRKIKNTKSIHSNNFH